MEASAVMPEAENLAGRDWKRPRKRIHSSNDLAKSATKVPCASSILLHVTLLQILLSET